MDSQPSDHRTILVSACLLGIRCRYDCGSQPHSAVKAAIGSIEIVPVCPEQMGGLTTPRAAAEIDGGDGADVLAGRAKVIDTAGLDRTDEFVRGAHECLALARLYSCSMAILKERSPSCGVGELSHKGRSIPGRGVCAALLASEGITVISEEDKELASILGERHEADI
ncbi:MAG: DUF523 domain-containing protein [bacterium]|nr:DUF523 domain-containing protein [bacterium]